MSIQFEERQKIARVWRAGRLLAGKTQTQLAKALEIPQSSISKYETMNLEPSASDWFRFCQYVGIDAHKTLNLGYIDSKTKFKSKLHTGSLFRLPLKYRRDFSMKIREFIPLKEALVELAGQETWKDFISSHEIDPEMFYVYDFQVSLELFLDLIGWSQMRSIDLLPKASSLSGFLPLHGLVKESLSTRTEAISFLKKIVENQNLYQNALETELEVSAKEARLLIKFQPWILDFYDQATLVAFRDYKATSFRELMKTNVPNFKGFKESKTDSSLTLSMRIV